MVGRDDDSARRFCRRGERTDGAGYVGATNLRAGAARSTDAACSRRSTFHQLQNDATEVDRDMVLKDAALYDGEAMNDVKCYVTRGRAEEMIEGPLVLSNASDVDNRAAFGAIHRGYAPFEIGKGSP